MNGQKILSRRWKKGKSPRQSLLSTRTDKLKRQQQASFFLLLADLLTVGFSIRHAIHFIGTVEPSLMWWTMKIDHRMQEGTGFTDSIRQEIKPDLYYQLLLAEKHGNLVKTLHEIGKLLSVQERQRKKLITLLQYPLLLLIMLAIVICCLVGFVFPELDMWQGESNPNLLIKVTVLAGSYFLTIIGISGLFQWYNWHRMSREQKLIKLCTIPVIGKCYRHYFQYYLTSVLGVMLQQGLSLAEICQLSQTFHGDSILYLFSGKVIKIIQRGGDISEAVKAYPFLPNELIIFMNKGTTIEKMGQDLTIFANLQFKALTNSIERLLVFVQPIIFSVIAVVIVGLYLSLLLPIYHSFQGVY
ncbi:type II secretion system F family protein [Limosilactobacillus sp. RRLNB_1_1]|uniref:Type II secretion system F family protein n=1 Tax=Limosilactobacillus albertensis TaxID=2759752 RepID=A0A7W3TPS4_9LACO|nr:type II secretion system F family protein [Limosilactobacillus albertensis]MBB1068619.1 type II secretion system F family protein [Limosilactobacillus albertensis]MCD7118210.1 type II secretion system F family protein [Limosilactobacillus albertensis]MCD7127492.1 type II secretion system F family protein [Limosilactobacillus albertensis]